MSRPLAFRHGRVQRARRLLTRAATRRSEGAYVIEGVKLVGEALDASAPLEAILLAAGADPDAAGSSQPGVREVVERAAAAGVRVFELAPGVLERVAATVTPQPLLAIARATPAPLSALREAGLVVVCADVRDPGNLGTVLRSAEAAGAGGVACCDGSVDVYNPKCVRASAGSVFHVPLVVGGDAVEVLAELGRSGFRRLGTVAAGGTPYHAVDFTRPVALVLGNEAYGLPDRLAGSLDGQVTIPMAGRAESLNVGMAAAVLCFEAARQRAAAPGAPAPPAGPPR